MKNLVIKSFQRPFAVSGKPIAFVTPSLIGLMLSLLVGFTLGFIVRHGLAHPFDKAVHVVFFAFFLFFAATSIRNKIVIPILAVFSLALGGEIIQGMLPLRDMSGGDLLANALGCLLGLLLLTRREQFFALCERSRLFRP